MALVDSEAAFDAHCEKIDGSGQLKKLMRDNGLKTLHSWHSCVELHKVRLTSLNLHHSV